MIGPLQTHYEGQPVHFSVVGRRLRKRYCNSAHDRLEVGISGTGNECRECKRIRARRRMAARAGESAKSRARNKQFANPYCPSGHFKPEVGVLPLGSCAECNKLLSIARRKRERRRNLNSRIHSVEMPKLRGVRQSLGLSLRDLARLTGLSWSYLGHIERGEMKARLEVQHKILVALTPLLAERRERISRAGI